MTSPTRAAAGKKLSTTTATSRWQLNSDNVIRVLTLISPKGSYSYTDANGELVEVKYTAGKDGFRILNENKPELPRATSSSKKQSNADWIQSIKASSPRNFTPTFEPLALLSLFPATRSPNPIVDKVMKQK